MSPAKKSISEDEPILQGLMRLPRATGVCSSFMKGAVKSAFIFMLKILEVYISGCFLRMDVYGSPLLPNLELYDIILNNWAPWLFSISTFCF